MKAKELLANAYTEDHPGVTERELPQYKELIGAGFKPIDGEQAHWQNCGDTVVLAVPDLNNAIKYDQIHEWITEHVNRCMKAVALLKPDEFEIQPLEGMRGYSHIIRLWWD
jgi:hypothetical protein